MTVGFWAPLPPVRSGVADYAETLRRALPGPLRLNADGDVNLYHLGNNGLHREIHRRAIESPGVVVLHDAVLHHFYLGSLTRDQYVDEFVFHYGPWYRGLAEELWAGRSRSASNHAYFRWPMLRRVAERSRAVIVHNRAAADLVRREAPHANVVVIPHLPLPMPDVDAIAIERWRARHGILPSHTLFGLMGFLRESKRVMPVLRAFQRVRTLRPGVHLLVAGRAEADLERALHGSAEMAGVIRETHLPEEVFQARLTACDAGLNLRYPSAGESSGLTARWLRIGRPVAVSEGPENEDFPVGFCPRVPTAVEEDDGLAAIMLLLAASPVRLRQCGLAARDWMERHRDLNSIAARFWRVLEECKS